MFKKCMAFTLAVSLFMGSMTMVATNDKKAPEETDSEQAKRYIKGTLSGIGATIAAYSMYHHGVLAKEYNKLEVEHITSGLTNVQPSILLIWIPDLVNALHNIANSSNIFTKTTGNIVNKFSLNPITAFTAAAGISAGLVCWLGNKAWQYFSGPAKQEEVKKGK